MNVINTIQLHSVYYVKIYWAFVRPFIACQIYKILLLHVFTKKYHTSTKHSPTKSPCNVISILILLQ